MPLEVSMATGMRHSSLLPQLAVVDFEIAFVAITLKSSCKSVFSGMKSLFSELIRMVIIIYVNYLFICSFIQLLCY